MSEKEKAPLRAGFARVEITPPLGTPLMGWETPSKRLASGVHDSLYCRALHLAQDGQNEVVILGLDVCFVGRGDYERLCGRLGRELGLLPHQILTCASHTHAGPAVGIYNELMWEPPPPAYLKQLDDAVVSAVVQARAASRQVRLRAAVGRSKLPMNRRQKRGDQIVNAPNPTGSVYDRLPVCLIESVNDGRPVCLLFACSTHPVCFSGTEVSADYPGVAMAKLDHHLGAPCSLFLQGMAGDSRPAMLARGQDWVSGPGAAETRVIGETLAAETLAVLRDLRELEVEPAALRSALIETRWPLQNNLDADDYRAIASGSNPSKARWARHELERSERGSPARPDHVSILMHGVRVGRGLQLIAIEGEPLHPYGTMIEEAFSDDRDAVTFAVGYANGEGMYLVTTPMLAEGGYEPQSFWEYHQPSSLAPGIERVAAEGLARLRYAVGG